MSAWQYIKVQPGSKRFSLLLSVLPSLCHVSSSFTWSAFLFPYSPSRSDLLSHALLSSAVSSHNSTIDRGSLEIILQKRGTGSILIWQRIAYFGSSEVLLLVRKKTIKWDNNLFSIKLSRCNYSLFKYNQIYISLQRNQMKMSRTSTQEYCRYCSDKMSHNISRLFGEDRA